MTLNELFGTMSPQTDKGTTHDYIAAYYDNEFNPIRDKDIRLLEIGTGEGWSIDLWSKWFTKAEIIGLDDKNGTWQWAKLNHPDWLLDDNRVKVRICDAYIDATLSLYEDESFDYIIDDGPHTVESQLVAIDKWLAKVKPGGKLIIEDIQSQSDLNRLIDAAASTGYDYKVFDMVNNKGRYDDIIIEITKTK